MYDLKPSDLQRTKGNISSTNDRKFHSSDVPVSCFVKKHLEDYASNLPSTIILPIEYWRVSFLNSRWLANNLDHTEIFLNFWNAVKTLFCQIRSHIIHEIIYLLSYRSQRQYIPSLTSRDSPFICLFWTWNMLQSHCWIIFTLAFKIKQSEL